MVFKRKIFICTCATLLSIFTFSAVYGQIPGSDSAVDYRLKHKPAIRTSIGYLEDPGEYMTSVLCYWRSYSTLSFMPAVGLNLIGKEMAAEAMLSLNLQYLNALHLRANVHGITTLKESYHVFSLGSGMSVWRFEVNLDFGLASGKRGFIRGGLGYVFNKNSPVLPKGWPGEK